MRKVRLFVCHHCRRVYRRKKSENSQSCYSCGKPMTAARKFPGPEWYARAKKVQMKEVELRVQENNRITFPRCNKGRKLRITKELKQIWRKMEKSKQRPALHRLSVQFIKELHEKCCHRFSPYGMTNPPDIQIVTGDERSSGWKGSYSRSIFRGYYIKVKHESIIEMKATFLHEAMHHVDAEAKTRKGEDFLPKNAGHDRAWQLRLKMFKEMLRVKDEEILNAS